MATRRMLVFVGSFALLIGAMLSALQLGQFVGGRSGEQAGRSSSSPASPAVPQPVILAAARPIAAGTLLRPQDVLRRDAVAGERPDELVLGADEAELMGAVVRRDIGAGQPLIANDIVKVGDRGFLAAALSPGLRAISIPLGPASSMAGLISPGDRVDVILMQNFAENGIQTPHKRVGETVLRNVRVIAIDQTFGASPPPAGKTQRAAIGTPPLPRSIALEVTRRQAETVFVALELGKVELSLRGSEGQPPAATSSGTDAAGPTWAEDVSPALRSLQPRDARPIAVRTAAPPHLTITRGTKTESDCVAPSGVVQACGGVALAVPAVPAAAAP
jgi:pilus assembly protein CpaB